jgi:acyl carrier protein
MTLLKENVSKFIVQNFGLHPNDFQDETLLFSSGLLDSFNLIELVSFIEKESGLKMGVMDVALENLDSIDFMMVYIEKRSA